jgi:LemA protein
MNKTFKVVLIVVAILAIIIMPIIGTYNRLVTLEQSVKRSEADIDTQLQRRSDLIPNLVETVRGYANHEREIFTDIADARSKLAGARDVNERANADTELATALARLLVVVENYPDLKANQNFRDLSVALENAENRISIARQDYNRAVDEYNTGIRRFPGAILAGMFRFDERPYYRAADGSRELDPVDFSR